MADYAGWYVYDATTATYVPATDSSTSTSSWPWRESVQATKKLMAKKRAEEKEFQEFCEWDQAED